MNSVFQTFREIRAIRSNRIEAFFKSKKDVLIIEQKTLLSIRNVYKTIQTRQLRD